MDQDKKKTGRPQIYTGEPGPQNRQNKVTEPIRSAGVQSSAGQRKAPAGNVDRVTERHDTDVRERRSAGAGRMAGEFTQGERKNPAERRVQAERKSPGEGQVQAGRQIQAERKRLGEGQVQAGRQIQAERKRLGEGQVQAGRQIQAERKSPGERQVQRVRTGKRPAAKMAPVAASGKQSQENERKIQILSIILGVLVVLLVAALIYEIVLGHGTQKSAKEREAEKAQKEQSIEILKDREKEAAEDKADNSGVQDGGQAETEADGNEAQQADSSADGAAADSTSGDPLKKAQLMAMQYDYDGAIELLKGTQGYAESGEYQAAVGEFEARKAECVPYPAAEVTHIFFHTLIHDAAKAFDGDEYEAGYNQFMVTEHEFRSIIEQMYGRGYVMVFIDSLVPGTDDGTGRRTFATKDIMLPPGKIPFVLSQDDVSYYHYMDGDGYASKLIIDENGDVKNEYIEDDGTVSVGDYDMVPIIDTFVKEHPDFSYHGQKGYVALTGYEGILGYRTDEVYKTREAGRVTVQQQMFFDSYPGGFDEAAFEKECESAKKVADAMKANGWRFASHTWGHQNMSETNGIDYTSFVRDTDRWENWVEPLIGETDTLIYAFGGDIRGMEKYSGERFNYFKQCGFDYFCGVDSAKYWLQVEPDYVRQSRRNVDGYRMYYNPDMLSDLFDVQKAWDPLRPSTVPPI